MVKVTPPVSARQDRSTALLVGWVTAAFLTLSAVGLGTYALLKPGAAPPTVSAVPATLAPSAEQPQADSLAPRLPIRLFAVGDIMLDRNVRAMMVKHGEDYPFAAMDSSVSGHDLVFANLEGPIVERYTATPTGSLRFSFPTSTGALLQRHGYNFLSITNNHSFDYGQAGYELERSVLAAAGIMAAGNAKAAREQDVVTTTVHNRKVVLLAFSSAVNKSFDSGAAVELVRQQALDEQAFVIVSIHWGTEYQTVGNAGQRQFAHDVIEAGADLVLGHHPHVVQDLEVYQHKLIAYSLGNYIFDQYFSTETQEELALDCTVGTSFSCELLPVVSVKSQPRLMVEPKRTTFLQALAARSDPALREEILAGRVVVNPPP